MKVAVLGAGGWGTALAIVLARRGHVVRLWARRAALARRLLRERENADYLPGHPLPLAIELPEDLLRAIAGVELVVVAVPVQHLRDTLSPLGGQLDPGVLRVGAAKGIERSTLLRVSEVLMEIWGPGPTAALSGPSFASEVARGEPTAITVASTDPGAARQAQAELAAENLRIYTSDDIVGVELGGALKNVIAIAAGMVRGMGFGANSLAAVLTRGLAEMSRLGVALGGRRETFLGLSGIGDLLLTGTGGQSRNARVGEAIARGEPLAKALGGSGMIAEGVETALSAELLARRSGVEMPITRQVVRVLHEGLDPRSAMRELMQRSLRAE